MNNKKRILLPVLMTSSLLLLTACGGSGSSGGTSSVNKTNTTTGTTTATETTTETDVTYDTLPAAYQAYIDDLASHVIVPNYQVLATAAADFTSNSQSYCDLMNAEQADLDNLQNQWKQLNQAWQQNQWLRFGPANENNRHFSLAFWPDNNGAVDRGVASLLANQETVTQSIVSNTQVGAQGIPALEQLLFTTDETTHLLTASDAVKRCEVVIAIAQNVHVIADELLNAWTSETGNYTDELTQASTAFPTTEDAVIEVLNKYLEHLERVKDFKLKRVVTVEGDIETFLSDQTKQNIITNLATFEQIYTAGGGYGLDDILTSPLLAQSSINEQIMTELALSQAQAAELVESFNTLVMTEAGQTQVLALVDRLQVLTEATSTELTQALDVDLGFNANDGD